MAPLLELLVGDVLTARPERDDCTLSQKQTNPKNESSKCKNEAHNYCMLRFSAFISRYQVGGRRHCAYSKTGNDCTQLFPRTYLPTAPDIIHSQHGQHSLVLPSVTNGKSTKLLYLDKRTEFFSNKSHETRLRSRLYPSASSSPCYVSVVSRQTCPSSVHTRLPFPENHLGELQLQPYIHNCAVTIHEGRRAHCFMVFYKRHCCLQANRCLTTMVQDATTTIRGDVIVMRLGSKASYVNLRSGDAKRTDWLMRR